MWKTHKAMLKDIVKSMSPFADKRVWRSLTSSALISDATYLNIQILHCLLIQIES